MKEKKNAGFSLVELIVVVLIMAIIAVALAPQVVRWIENSRIASDLETRTGLEKACQLAVTNEDIFSTVEPGGYTIVITKDRLGNIDVECNSGTDSGGKGSGAFWDQFFNLIGYEDYNDFCNSIEIKSSPITSDKIVLTVHLYESGNTFSTLTGVAETEIKVS